MINKKIIKCYLYLFTFLFLINIVSSLPQDSDIGLTFQYPIDYSDIVINETANVSNYWSTNDGYLYGIDTDMFNNDAGFLTVVKSWWDNLYCELTGCTMAGDIDMGGNDILNIGLLGADIEDLDNVNDSASDLDFLQYNASSNMWHPISIESTYYNATSYQLVAGTLDGGTLNDTKHSDGNYDGVSLNISEDNTAPGLDIRVNFTGIDKFDRGIVRYKTSDLVTPFPYFQIYDYDDGEWENYAQAVESLNYRIAEVPVFDDTGHIQDGVVQIRLYKEDTGKTNNHYYFDWLAISKGFGTPTGEEVDPVWENEKENYYNITEINNNFSNYYNITQIENNFSNYYNITQIESNLSNYIKNNTDGGYYADLDSLNVEGNNPINITNTGWSSSTGQEGINIISKHTNAMGMFYAKGVTIGIDSVGTYAGGKLHIYSQMGGAGVGGEFDGSIYIQAMKQNAEGGDIHIFSDEYSNDAGSLYLQEEAGEVIIGDNSSHQGIKVYIDGDEGGAIASPSVIQAYGGTARGSSDPSDGGDNIIEATDGGTGSGVPASLDGGDGGNNIFRPGEKGTGFNGGADGIDGYNIFEKNSLFGMNTSHASNNSRVEVLGNLTIINGSLYTESPYTRGYNYTQKKIVDDLAHPKEMLDEKGHLKMSILPNDEKRTTAFYPYKKTVTREWNGTKYQKEITDYSRPVFKEQIDMFQIIQKNKIMISELNEENKNLIEKIEILETELCKKDNTYSFCGGAIRE